MKNGTNSTIKVELTQEELRETLDLLESLIQGDTVNGPEYTGAGLVSENRRQAQESPEEDRRDPGVVSAYMKLYRAEKAEGLE